MRRYRPIAEAFGLLAVTFPLAVGLHVPTLWFLMPLAWITFSKRSYSTYGLTWERPEGIAFHSAVVVAVFVPYVIGHYAFAHWWLGARFQFRWPPEFLEAVVDLFGVSFHLHWPAAFLNSLVFQVLVIALPEEFFFRGYFQTECDRVFGKPYRCLGADCGLGLPLASAVFAVCHVVFGGPAGLSRFFPGLLYGWLRARTSTIAVPVAYHAVSNLLMSIMVASLG